MPKLYLTEHEARALGLPSIQEQIKTWNAAKSIISAERLKVHCRNCGADHFGPVTTCSNCKGEGYDDV